MLFPSHDRGGETVAEVEDIATCLVLTFRTARTGRAFRGRNYVRGIPNSMITNNLISQTFINNIVAGYVSIDDAVDQASYTLVVRQGQVDGVKLNPAQTTVMTNIVARNAVPGHQRLTFRRP